MVSSSKTTWYSAAGIRTGLLLSTLVCFPAVAQAASTQYDDVFSMPLEELTMVQIASRFLEDVADVGSSVTVVTETQWRRFGAEKTLDAIEHIPGVYVTEYFHGQMIPTFRGFASSEQYNSFLILLDDMPLNSYSSAAATYGTPNYALGNLDRIEVIRGPGSTIYGADAFNGVVSLNTWDSKEDVLETWAEIGSFGFWQGNVRVRHGFSDRISLTSSLSIGTVDNEELQDNFTSSGPGHPYVEAQVAGEYENLTTTNKMRIGNLEIGAYYSKHDVEDSFGTGEVAGIFPNGNHTNGMAEIFALKLSHQTQLTNRWELDSKLFSVQESLFGSFGITNPGSSPLPPSLDWDSKDHRVGAEFIGHRPFGESNSTLTIGTTFEQAEVQRFGAVLSGSPPAVRNQHRQMLGLMGQWAHKFANGRWQINLGGRFDDYSDFGNHLSPRLALIFHPTNNQTMKFLFGNAFRAPAINEQIDSGVVQGGGQSLNPERVDTYELVWMHQAGVWRYAVNAYLSEIEDGIVIGLSTDPEFILQFQNEAQARSKGVEFEARARFERWSIETNLAWNSARATGEVSVSDVFRAYPDWILNLGIDYQINARWSSTLYNTFHQGRDTLNPTEVVAPSYPDREPLSPLLRSDLHLNWQPTDRDFSPEFYLNILDILGRADQQSSIGTVETGRSTPGRKIILGARVSL